MAIVDGSVFCALSTLSWTAVTAVSASDNAGANPGGAPWGGVSIIETIAALRSYCNATTRSATWAATAGWAAGAAAVCGVGSSVVSGGALASRGAEAGTGADVAGAAADGAGAAGNGAAGNLASATIFSATVAAASSLGVSSGSGTRTIERTIDASFDSAASTTLLTNAISRSGSARAFDGSMRATNGSNVRSDAARASL